MSATELRLVIVLGLLALGALAALGSLAIAHLRRSTRHLKERARRALPLRGDARELARSIDRRQAAWRLRC
jgi:hypothetical protein